MRHQATAHVTGSIVTGLSFLFQGIMKCMLYQILLPPAATTSPALSLSPPTKAVDPHRRILLPFPSGFSYRSGCLHSVTPHTDVGFFCVFPSWYVLLFCDILSFVMLCYVMLCPIILTDVMITSTTCSINSHPTFHTKLPTKTREPLYLLICVPVY